MTCMCVMQTRMGSSRLPGKVMKPIAGKEVLYWDIVRALAARSLDGLVIATSDRPGDDVIARYVEELRAREGLTRLHLFRGSELDVLDRYYQAARGLNLDVVVRVTSDCPLIDPAVIDQLVGEYRRRDCDYLANRIEIRTWPHGMDVEVFSLAALERAWREGTAAEDREHVTPYITNNPSLFRVFEIPMQPDLSDVRITVDYQEDLDLMNALVRDMGPGRMDFTMDEIVAAYRRVTKPRL